MQLRDSHPSDRELLLAADGEMPAHRVEWLRKHLASCWECRARAQELEGAIAEFVHFHRRNLDPLLPPIAGRRALLKAQLSEISSSHGSSFRRWRQLAPWTRQLVLGVGFCVLVSIVAAIPHHWSSRGAPATYAGFVPMSFPTTTLTPGVARPASRQQVCGSKDGKNRDVPVALRRKVFELYGIPRADPKAYEVDYLITPALGGADDIGNLWPQSYSATVWNARVKDALEDRLHEMVCRGDVDLATAQREISTDWIAAYKKYFRTDRPNN
jgi:hypothetical protein